MIWLSAWVTAIVALGVVTSAYAAPKDTLVLAIGGEPDNGFDPIAGWGSYGNPLFQSTLLRRDVNLDTQPDLATNWTLSDDRKVWTIELRDDVRFSDGSPVTAEDVAFTFNTAKASANSIDLSVMVEAVAVDQNIVRISLNKPWITFVEAFYTLGIVPAASYGLDYGRRPVGSGPYKFVAWNEGQQLIVERNDAYYGDKGPFQRITFLFTGEAPGLAAANAGVVDMVAVPAQLADAIPEGFNAVHVQTVDNRGLSLPFTTPHVVDGRTVGNAVTSDPAIRKAINMGLDRKLVVDVALHGHGTPAFGPADGLPWAGEADTIEFNFDGAKAILDEARWVTGDDGIRSKDGVRAEFPIHYPASDASRQALAEISAELLRPLGIQATPRGGSWDAIQRVMHSEPVVFGFGSHSPYQLYSLFAEKLGGVGYMNPSYYANEQVEALFEKAQGAGSLEASMPFWSQAADYYGLKGDSSWAWLTNFDHVYFVNKCLDLGKTQIEPHGHGWPVTATIASWRWTCE
ncbi:ABC transporter substrate-binding protein [Aureimonas fodinaquatilis]|uniref:ABC transporter substrate-binding protein n=1 Tax=Aureimonas fodinaquatilis TaxID=2565783 RepID=A0A5B0E238_9HYPH|nr:ABC transporter substrate-binding protein [Aureimonas fodinaquatilis]KAA0972021.1 ABC transporter substrate-binding protein [Aureimonas fodinaquatilis]